MKEVETFYANNPQIKTSHGLSHALAVSEHAKQAVACHEPMIPDNVRSDIIIAALLHDVDDRKYFPGGGDFPNARAIMTRAHFDGAERVVRMIQLVSCSANGNSVPAWLRETGAFHLLIPRWADRLEAVGAAGVLRCFQYNTEHEQPLWSDHSPRPQTEAEVWAHAKPERFEGYQSRGGTSTDMISHYYDKLLHVSRPPPEIVRNSYLEAKAAASAQPLVDVCLHFGREGSVDEAFLANLALRDQTE
eukprot:CAMPEP_0119126158 /NCGR_PEP_ID=MMETSP1310-20130426/5187_1 /TAXON_ID=464262 /ORGANISM="Genus nov. species nov., Strain RCC2339" /LENGTH=246 /DNA_ID=CAMNT_0007116297 /DNA_START=185 /DNA_END=925 /DNA_ORIENTATION=+